MISISILICSLHPKKTECFCGMDHVSQTGWGFCPKVIIIIFSGWGYSCSMYIDISPEKTCQVCALLLQKRLPRVTCSGKVFISQTCSQKVPIIAAQVKLLVQACCFYVRWFHACVFAIMLFRYFLVAGRISLRLHIVFLISRSPLYLSATHYWWLYDLNVFCFLYGTICFTGSVRRHGWAANG